MAGSKTFKFHGSQIQVLTGWGTDSPSQAVTAITRANPAVVSSASHGLSDGAVAMLDNIVGMTELNDEAFVLINTASGTFELADVNSTDYAAYISGGNVITGEFSNLCELTNYNRQGGSTPESPSTSLCSEAQEYELGLPDFGTTQMDFKFAPRTAIQMALQAFYRSAEKMAVRIILPNDGGYMVQMGFVQQMSESAGNGGIWTGSVTIRNTGARVDIAA